MKAMQKEMESLMHHNVWELTELPPGTNPVKCKWVFKKKETNSEGKAARC